MLDEARHDECGGSMNRTMIHYLTYEVTYDDVMREGWWGESFSRGGAGRLGRVKKCSDHDKLVGTPTNFGT